MKKLRCTPKPYLLILIGFCAVQLFGQHPASTEIANAETHLLASIYTKKEYQIRVRLPQGYTIEDDIKYPVLYVLDGKYANELFNSILKTFALGKELNEPIVVTIDGNTLTETEWLANRHHDYTPSYDPKADYEIANYFKIPLITSGGGKAFLDTLEKEIIPLIEKKYKTSFERGLFGHSLGGLFAGYCLTTRPYLFQKYALNSPSFWWKEGELVKNLDALAVQEQKTDVAIFISVGELEGEFMIAPVKGFEKSLREKFPKSTITSKLFEGETHLSVVPMACSRSLRLFYGKTGVAGF